MPNEETVNGHKVRGEIRTYWRAKGDIQVFGLPLTEEFLWVNPDTITPSAPQGKATTVQVFERQILEFDAAETNAAWRVRGLQVGRLWMSAHNIKG